MHTLLMELLSRILTDSLSHSPIMRLLPQKNSVKSYLLGEVLASSLVEAPTFENYTSRLILALHIMVTTGRNDFLITITT